MRKGPHGMQEFINESLPDGKVLQELREFLHDASGKPFEVSGEKILIPEDVELCIVAKVFYSYNFDIGFGNHYRVLVAIGGVEQVANGIVDASICFVLGYFNTNGGLITVDLNREML